MNDFHFQMFYYKYILKKIKFFLDFFWFFANNEVAKVIIRIWEINLDNQELKSAL